VGAAARVVILWLFPGTFAAMERKTEKAQPWRHEWVVLLHTKIDHPAKGKWRQTRARQLVWQQGRHRGNEMARSKGKTEPPAGVFPLPLPTHLAISTCLPAPPPFHPSPTWISTHSFMPAVCCLALLDCACPPTENWWRLCFNNRFLCSRFPLWRH